MVRNSRRGFPTQSRWGVRARRAATALLLGTPAWATGCAGWLAPPPVFGAEPADSRAVFNEAMQLFFAARPVEAARLFDRLVELEPAAEPHLWQRGLALYYAGRFEDGRAQFELHRTVNPNDVENPAWHFLCVARLEGVETARAKLLPVGEDPRVPMKEILALFQGQGDEEAVLRAAEQGEGEARRNQLCYAHLYLGLFHEAAGDADKARDHIAQAAGPFRMDHAMGKVAVMHARLRGRGAGEQDRKQEAKSPSAEGITAPGS